VRSLRSQAASVSSVKEKRSVSQRASCHAKRVKRARAVERVVASKQDARSRVDAEAPPGESRSHMEMVTVSYFSGGFFRRLYVYRVHRVAVIQAM
jgi:hypothetical protein